MAASEVDLRRRWSGGRPGHGLWSLLPGPVTGELLARTGADYVVVRDAAHAREVVAAGRYAPAGGRSIGRLSGGADRPLVVVMVEAATRWTTSTPSWPSRGWTACTSARATSPCRWG